MVASPVATSLVQLQDIAGAAAFAATDADSDSRGCAAGTVQALQEATPGRDVREGRSVDRDAKRAAFGSIVGNADANMLSAPRAMVQQTEQVKKLSAAAWKQVDAEESSEIDYSTLEHGDAGANDSAGANTIATSIRRALSDALHVGRRGNGGAGNGSAAMPLPQEPPAAHARRATIGSVVSSVIGSLSNSLTTNSFTMAPPGFTSTLPLPSHSRHIFVPKRAAMLPGKRNSSPEIQPAQMRAKCATPHLRALPGPFAPLASPAATRTYVPPSPHTCKVTHSPRSADTNTPPSTVRGGSVPLALYLPRTPSTGRTVTPPNSNQRDNVPSACKASVTSKKRSLVVDAHGVICASNGSSALATPRTSPYFEVHRSASSSHITPADSTVSIATRDRTEGVYLPTPPTGVVPRLVAFFTNLPTIASVNILGTGSSELESPRQQRTQTGGSTHQQRTQCNSGAAQVRAPSSSKGRKQSAQAGGAADNSSDMV